ncbi:hypothetical protein CH274_13090 [Rhodococcus sp. 06-418-5]|uniref:hypothetical protein n=1 Tax=Rhodococcus sp. 06-418-5 TaxID=2022507 RepID=UPI000B9B770B|nr:hypothetical protein [Rhodococcus sp. 06-418-5]OZC80166.1 hypothetical protein CH274_13090 [Rhodococcus sp. 06-418-5]
MDETDIRSTLRRLRDKREQLTARIAELDVERAEAVAAGFDAGLSASAMIEDSGLSQQRLSQLKRGGAKGRR